MGTVSLLRRNRRFRWLWCADVVSFLGDWLNTIALYTIVDELSGTGRAFAGVMVAKTLPVFLVTPLAGPLVDRADRRTLMLVMDWGRALGALGLIVAHRMGSLPGLYLCMILMVGMTGVFFPSRSAAIPQVTAREDLGLANSLSGGTWSVMLAFGAALGGWITAAIGPDASLVVDAFTFLLSSVFLLLLPRLPAPAGEDREADRSFVGGIRHLGESRRTLALASLKPMMALGGGALVLLPIFATSVFPARSGPLWLGGLYAARGLGALVGSIALVRLFGDSSAVLRRWILALFPLTAFAYLGLGWAPTYGTAALAFCVAAIGSGGVWVMSGTLLHREGDRRFLGRVFSVEFGVMTLVVSATGWLAGVALDDFGLTPRGVARVTAALYVVPMLLWSLELIRGPRDVDRDVRTEVPSEESLPPPA